MFIILFGPFYQSHLPEVPLTDKIVVLSTAGSVEEAAAIARRLVESRLAACVNLVPGVTSIYRWQDAIEESPECLMVIKTRRECFAALREEIGKAHSYSVPEVISLAVVDGSPAYLEWLDRETQAGS